MQLSSPCIDAGRNDVVQHFMYNQPFTSLPAEDADLGERRVGLRGPARADLGAFEKPVTARGSRARIER